MKKKARRGGGRQLEARVEALGARGDGVVTLPEGPLFLPQTLPGGRVRARVLGQQGGMLQGDVLELLEPSPDRVEAPCPHFGPCGGCQVQHLAPERYGPWKRGLLVEALGKRGFEAAEALVRPLVALPPGTRRRAVFAAERRGRRAVLGFHRRASHQIEDLSTCLLLEPALVALLPPLREGLAAVLPEGGKADVTLLATESGIDLLLSLPEQPDLAARESLAALAAGLDLARLSLAVGDEPPLPLAERRAPLVSLGGVALVPPAGGFLQPTRAGEQALASLVLEALGGAGETIADLYSGCGTFTFPLAAAGHRVHAVEGDLPALEALERAARKSGLWGRITAERRDLARNPVTAEELEGGDAAVFDPPRGGARAQAEALAESDVPLLAAVSCNPATFARDARILVEGGYRFDWAQPLDQFPWSGHLELVARFSRPEA